MPPWWYRARLRSLRVVPCWLSAGSVRMLTAVRMTIAMFVLLSLVMPRDAHSQARAGRISAPGRDGGPMARFRDATVIVVAPDGFGSGPAPWRAVQQAAW